jgi:hypothetical protein
MDFTIPEEYMASVDVRTEHDFVKDRDNPTAEDLIKILKGIDKMVTHSTKDHDEFTILRNQLEELGYIRCERRWWNGDVVLKPFTLNGFKFIIGRKFPCADAMKISFQLAKEYRRKTID